MDPDEYEDDIDEGPTGETADCECECYGGSCEESCDCEDGCAWGTYEGFEPCDCEP